MDKWLDRVMKLIGLFGFVWAAFTWGAGQASIPKRVYASEAEIVRVKAWEADTNVRLARMETDIKYLRLSADEIKSALRQKR